MKPKGKLRPVALPPVKAKATVKPTKERVISATAKPFAKQWPKILAYIIANPDDTYQQIWKRYRNRITDIISFNEFKAKLVSAGITKKNVTQSLSIKGQVTEAIKTFADVKKEHAERHLTRIHRKLEQIHDVVEKLDVNDQNVGRTLDLVSRLHKEGRIAYGIDEESRGDQKVTNLAVMIGFQPQEKKAQAIDV